MKRKGPLVKVNVPRNEDSVGNRIIAAIAFGVWWVSEKNACHGARCKFVRSGGGDARITKTPKNTKIII